ncbi:MAG: hypothetical protein ACOX8F_06825 [Sakamotonia sp.]
MNNIKMAYLLVAHKCPEQVNIFISQLLNYGDCDIYIHVDKKNPELFDKIIESPRVIKCSVYDVRWGSFEIVKAALELMRLAKESGRKYTHMYFGSGQDLLIKQGLYDFLANNSKQIFLKIVGEVKNTDRASARYRICWPHKLMIRNDVHPYRFVRIFMQILCRFGIVINKNKKILKREISFYEGRTWFIAPIYVLDYIVDYVEQNPDYVDYWEDSLASDLMFFQTLIMNSPYAGMVKDELMYVKFGKTFATMNHPITINLETAKKIQNDRFFFARKFEIEEKEAIEFFVEKLEREK